MISWGVVLLWLALIFCLSHQPVTESKGLSTGVAEVVMQAVEQVAPAADLDINRVDHLVRKNAHFFVYLVLGALMLNALRRSGMTGIKSVGLAMLLCLLYAISDEVHQTFVPGRGGQVEDVLLDSMGAAIGIGAYLLVRKKD